MPLILQNSTRFALLTFVLLAAAGRVSATVDDAQAFALQAAETYVKDGFQVREDYWGGDLGAPEQKAVKQQLFKGNEYWFWLGTEVEKAKISVHIYDSEGKLVESDSWQKSRFAAARVLPQTTGSYFIIVSVEESPEERTHWALVYGFR